MSKCIFYAVYINEQTHYYTAFDIVCLIELGVLGPNDYCYCFHKNKWQAIIDDPYIVEGLDPKFLKMKTTKTDGELAKHFNFTPDPPEGKKIYTLVDKFMKHQNASEKNQASQNEEDYLKRTIDELNGKIIGFKKREAENKKYIEKLLSDKKAGTSEFSHWEEIIGEVFELTDKAEWYLKREGKLQGPFSFSQVYEQYKEGIIEGKTLIRKEEERVFNRISEVYEFNTKVFSKDSKLYVRRADYRVPFYEIAEISFGDFTWKGHCTNLSIGGCYIEFSNFPKEITTNAVVNFKLVSKTLGEKITAQMIVKNINSGRSAGMGCEFLDLSAPNKELISHYVMSYLGQFGQLGA